MTETGHARRPARRSVLGLGAAAGLGLALPYGRAHAQTRTDGARPRARRRPDWSEPGVAFLRDVRLHHSTVQQSSTFDERGGRLYSLQVIESGVRLPGESRSYSHDERVRRGDLCLNRLTTDGELLDHMYLKGFGHGTTITAESRTAGRTELWTEWDANPASGYGRGICRFRYAPGKVFTSDTASLTTFRPQPGSTNNYAALDTVNRRLLLRYRRADLPRYALYDLDGFAAHDFRPLADFAQPGADLGLPFQGMALHGDYAYQLLGSAYGKGNPPSRGGNARLFRISLPDGLEADEVLERTDPDLNVREPEGLTVTHRGGPRLVLGFAHDPVGARRFSLYWKSLA